MPFRLNLRSTILRHAARALACVLAISAPPAIAQDQAVTEPAAVHFGLTRGMFNDVNENDAAAAVSIYLKTLGSEFGLDAKPYILEGPAAMAKALRQGEVDLLGISALEFFELEKDGVVEGPFLMSLMNDGVTEEYVLLARASGPIRGVEDLRGRSLILSSEIRAALAPLWLEILLRQGGLGTTKEVLGKVAYAARPAQVVLPVFFGKMDACIVTRRAWDLMGELNPQVTTQLRAIAVSPRVIPGFTCFRRGISPVLKRRIVETTVASHTKASFQQVMELFKTGRLVERPLSDVDATRKLVSTYRELTSGKPSAKGATAGEAEKRSEGRLPH